MPERLFRKRPVVVAALQWTGSNEQELAEFTRGNFMAADEADRGNSDDPENTGAVLDSLHASWIGMSTGDWVVRGPRGEFYAIKDDVLAETYEPVGAVGAGGESPTPQQVLAAPMGENDADATTVRDYLIKLLAKLWREMEGFDSKRPFGNSGWDGEIALALVRAGFVEGEIDEEYGYLDGADYGRVEALVLAAIESLGTVDADG